MSNTHKKSFLAAGRWNQYIPFGGYNKSWFLAVRVIKLTGFLIRFKDNISYQVKFVCIFQGSNQQTPPLTGLAMPSPGLKSSPWRGQSLPGSTAPTTTAGPTGRECCLSLWSITRTRQTHSYITLCWMRGLLLSDCWDSFKYDLVVSKIWKK